MAQEEKRRGKPCWARLAPAETGKEGRGLASGPWRGDGPTGRMEGGRERIRIFFFFSEMTFSKYILKDF
jgi:hypothetical protein